MTDFRPFAFALVTTLALSACGVEEITEPAEEATAPAAAAPPAAAEPEPAAPAAPAAPEATGGAMTIAALRASFTADQAGLVGREVTVRGLFSSATSVGGTLNNISMLGSRDDDFMSSVICGFGDDAPASVDLTQYAEVTVRGRVRERFGRPALEDCAIVE
ncbi:MAG: hypothetical protein H6719_28395 [Sandaracinaceae bacterium]|nr:hypothetical protein [Sandaracinaceae bacterium]